MEYFTDNTEQLAGDQSLNNPVLYSMSGINGEGRRGSGHHKRLSSNKHAYRYMG
jgi:hypothetical protein